MATNGNSAPAMQKLRRLVRGFRVAMMTTAAEDGSLHSRPMATRETMKEGSLWFFSSCDTEKVREIGGNHKVNVTYSDPENDRYVSLTGTCEVIQDRGKMLQLWTPALYAWFPQGPDTPNMALLRVEVERAEYWDPRAGRFSDLMERVRSAITGTPVLPGKHGRIEIGHPEAPKPPAAPPS